MVKIVQFRQAVADVIRHRRTLAGLTQPQLAELIGGSEIGVRTWERAASSPSLETFLLLADALGVDAGELLSEIRNKMAHFQSHAQNS
ncbi:MAG: helix-turn-helix domain-containing protein [Desulfovibrionaceae bacterium]|nr:helix-turn-helix domain-containing protein [Desulfovibrionaceae bacterium]